MNLIALAKTAGSLTGVLKAPHRKKKLVVAVGGLLTVLLVKYGVPPDIAEALAEVVQAGLE